MRPSIVFGSLCVVFSMFIVGCGGGGVEKEIDALKADIPNIKDAASYQAFMQKGSKIAEKIQSAPDDKKMELAGKLSQVMLEGTQKGLTVGGMPGIPGGIKMPDMKMPAMP